MIGWQSATKKKKSNQHNKMTSSLLNKYRENPFYLSLLAGSCLKLTAISKYRHVTPTLTDTGY